MEFTEQKYTACPGFILIDPLEKEEKSTMLSVQDSVDKLYKGIVVSVGEPKFTEYGHYIESPVKVGDMVLYSIAGIEETKLAWKDNPRKRFIIAPFGRILLKIT